MLIATPYRDFDVRDRHPPKIISEMRKTYLNSTSTSLRPKLTGDLLVKSGSDKNWYPRRVQVRGGQLHVCPAPDGVGPCPMRLPLRHLSLQAGPLPHSLAICRGQNIVLTLQTADERAFDEWVKIIAIELIRQTPLDAIKYLDILTLAECWQRREKHYEKDWNCNNVISEKTSPYLNCAKTTTATTREFEATPRGTCSNEKPPRNNPLLLTNSKDPEDVVENLLKKCQNVENYVPVKEKLFLFESLCKMGRKVRSSEDVSLKLETSATKRARSLHDLSNINTHIAVREICKYFENRKDPGEDRSAPTRVGANFKNPFRFQSVISAT